MQSRQHPPTRRIAHQTTTPTRAERRVATASLLVGIGVGTILGASFADSHRPRVTVTDPDCLEPHPNHDDGDA